MQTFTDFLKDLVGNFAFGTFQIQVLIVMLGVTNRHFGNLADGFVFDSHMTRNFI